MALGTWAASPEERAAMAKAKQLQAKLREYKDKPPTVAVIRAFAEEVKKGHRDLTTAARNDSTMKAISEEFSKFDLTFPSWVKRSREAEATSKAATPMPSSEQTKPRTPEQERGLKAMEAARTMEHYSRGETKGAENLFKSYGLSAEQGATLQAALEGKKFGVRSSTTLAVLIRKEWLEDSHGMGVYPPTQKAKDAWAKVKK